MEIAVEKSYEMIQFICVGPLFFCGDFHDDDDPRPQILGDTALEVVSPSSGTLMPM